MEPIKPHETIYSSNGCTASCEAMLIEPSDIQWNRSSRVCCWIVIDARHQTVHVHVENDNLGPRITACDMQFEGNLVRPNGVHRSGVLHHFLAHSCDVARL